MDGGNVIRRQLAIELCAYLQFTGTSRSSFCDADTAVDGVIFDGASGALSAKNSLQRDVIFLRCANSLAGG